MIATTTEIMNYERPFAKRAVARDPFLARLAYF